MVYCVQKYMKKQQSLRTSKENPVHHIQIKIMTDTNPKSDILSSVGPTINNAIWSKVSRADKKYSSAFTVRELNQSAID